jgi:amidase
LLDLLAVVFPIKNYDSSEGSIPEPRNNIEWSIFAQWEPGIYAKAPLSLQLVGQKHNEEKLLAMLDVVEKAVGGRN